jgi:hypothetical protein
MLSEPLLVDCKPIPLFSRAPIHSSTVSINIGKSTVWEVPDLGGFSLVALPRLFAISDSDDTDGTGI